MAMAQNRSHAVMAQRVEPHDSLDDFPTPPWATRALCEYVIGIHRRANLKAWEPACNRGYMVEPLKDYFGDVFGSDIHDYKGGKYGVQDFLFPGSPRPFAPDWIITNPPFRLGEQFARRALEITRVGVALFVRTAFLEGIGRYNRLFYQTPPAIIAQFSERVVLHKGKLTKAGSTATAYCWVVWNPPIVKQRTTRFIWIPPCRKQLERDSDYAEE